MSEYVSEMGVERIYFREMNMSKLHRRL
ncbi:hypothetical protein Golob_004677 [Gossypium lobatum]|uniref:Uncharacterized protein n=1 Tax=Gossypium lobatum TaxID=34289 RepID=A0A7J8N2E9_9ROSI|nr:hypothetical protein [Gossypium lobatum]